MVVEDDCCYLFATIVLHKHCLLMILFRLPVSIAGSFGDAAAELALPALLLMATLR